MLVEPFFILFDMYGMIIFIIQNCFDSHKLRLLVDHFDVKITHLRSLIAAQLTLPWALGGSTSLLIIFSLMREVM